MFRNLIMVAVLLFQAAAVQASPLMTCIELTSGHRLLEIEATSKGVEAHLNGRIIAGTANQGTYSFVVGDWQTADFFTLEIKPVNGRYVGVSLEHAEHGDLPFQKGVFRCAEIGGGAASSNGGF